MYVRVHNESDLDLNYLLGPITISIFKKASSYVDLANYKQITFFYEEGTYTEYVRYFKEIDVKEIFRSDIYVNFENKKVVIKQEEWKLEELFC